MATPSMREQMERQWSDQSTAPLGDSRTYPIERFYQSSPSELKIIVTNTDNESCLSQPTTTSATANLNSDSKTLRSSIKLSAIASAKDSSDRGSANDTTWRVGWRHKDTCYYKVYGDKDGDLDCSNGLESALRAISHIVEHGEIEGAIEILDWQTLPPLWKQWNLQELHVLEKSYILSSEVCRSHGVSLAPPSICIGSSISVTPSKQLMDAILCEIKGSSYETASDGESSLSSVSYTEASEQMRGITKKQDEGSLKVNTERAYEDCTTTGCDDSNSSSQKANFVNSVKSHTPAGKRSVSGSDGNTCTVKKQRPNKKQPTAKGLFAGKGFAIPHAASEESPFALDVDDTKQCYMHKPLENETKPCDKSTNSSEPSDPLASVLVKVEGHSSLDEMDPTYPAQLGTSAYSINTTEQEESMLNILETLKKELVTEHSHLHENRLLCDSIPLGEYMEVLREIPTRLNEHLTKMRVLDADVKILLFDQCTPLQKALSQLCTEKQTKVDGTMEAKRKDSSIAGKISGENEELHADGNESTSVLSPCDDRRNKVTDPSTKAAEMSELCVENANAEATASPVALASSTTYGCASSTLPAALTSPSATYWAEPELQKLRLCEKLYTQIESASTLKIDLCDNLYTMLERQIDLFDSKFKQYETFHDLFYGKDVIKQNVAPTSNSKYKKLMVKQIDPFIPKEIQEKDRTEKFSQDGTSYSFGE